MKISKLICFKFIIAIGFLVTITSCTPEEKKCETKTVCYGEGNCIETPIVETCF